MENGRTGKQGNHSVALGEVVFCILGVWGSHVLSQAGVCYGYSHVVPRVCFRAFPRRHSGTNLIRAGAFVVLSDPSVAAAISLGHFCLRVRCVWEWVCAGF